MVPLLIDSLLLGAQHSFEPDHMAAVSVLASEKRCYGAGSAAGRRRVMGRLIWRSSHWALGHSATLIVFSVLALLLKSALPLNISSWAEMAVGPIMVWLGISAIRRNHRLKKMMAEHKKFEEHEHRTNTLHLHGRQGEEVALNPLSRSFWVGMLHGLAGTGGACAGGLAPLGREVFPALSVILLRRPRTTVHPTTLCSPFAFFP